MRRVLVIAAVIAAVLVAGLSGTALAGPAVTEHGVTNPLAWGLASLKTTRVYASTDASGASLVIDVLDHSGVCKVLYGGAAAAPGVRLYTAPWDGRDYRGVRLQTGNYKYRVRVTKDGVTTSVSGSMPLCRSRFTLVTDRDREFSRYFYAGVTRVYAQCDRVGAASVFVDLYRQSDLRWIWDTGTLRLDLPYTAAAARWTRSWVFSVPVKGGHWVDMGATDDDGARGPTYPPIKGTLTLTIMQ